MSVLLKDLDDGDKIIYVANIGDSRAVLCCQRNKEGYTIPSLNFHSKIYDLIINCWVLHITQICSCNGKRILGAEIIY